MPVRYEPPFPVGPIRRFMNFGLFNNPLLTGRLPFLKGAPWRGSLRNLYDLYTIFTFTRSFR